MTNQPRMPIKSNIQGAIDRLRRVNAGESPEYVYREDLATSVTLTEMEYHTIASRGIRDDQELLSKAMLCLPEHIETSLMLWLTKRNMGGN